MMMASSVVPFRIPHRPLLKLGTLLLLCPAFTVVVVEAYSVVKVSPEINNNNNKSSRRSFLGDVRAALVTTTSSVLLVPQVAKGVEESYGTILDTTGSIQRYPPIQFLFPIYNLQESLDFIEANLNSQTSEGIRQASESVDQFLAGGFLSNKNLFKSLCTIYIGEIKFTSSAYENDQRKAIQNAFLADCDQILEGIVNLQKPLQLLVKDGATTPTPEVVGYFQDSQTGLSQFLKKIPQDNITQLQELIVRVQKADVNQNGKLDRNELDFLSDADLEVCKTVGPELILKAKVT